MGLENQVALVTGAASEIGQAYVKNLLKNRVKVLLCDECVEKCHAIVSEFEKEFQKINVLSIKCDVTNEEEFENVFKTCMKYFGRLDIVINNAGVFDESIVRWSSVVNINYGGVVRGTLLAIKYMGIPNGGIGGTVIQTTSFLVFGGCFSNTPLYKSTKKYITDFTKRLGGKRQFGLHGVKLITLCPGFTGTKFPETLNQIESVNDSVEHVEDNHGSNNQMILQDSENVGNALIIILEQGKNGETWIVEDNKPPRLVEY
ncbi:15-hydroxyprostaglandin dehydrogenase [NAD(+)]-like [Sipha flava]|uniref:15-hydroxyprostaglandin dehydrogenase [NAD(+)] n=1 Tax=Sipha flava TaxID=143950 RepID=A0A8B8GE71_9HEMI|nr:15-hydroxyprostaglandin dehydrogenase [NAD(+)]-like [Sipha flava]